MKKTIHHFQSNKSGPTLAIFCGVHGNEKAGIQAVQEFIRSFEPQCGEVYFVFANPLAIEKGVRMLESNLNRCFTARNPGKTPEQKRAQELMRLLDNCDALLDLHGYNSDEDKPFAIGEQASLPLIQKLPVEMVLTNLGALSTGATDAYMHAKGKIGICLECGSNNRPEDYVALATSAIKIFLGHFGIILPLKDQKPLSQKIFRAISVVKRQTTDFSFNKTYRNFDLLTPGDQFAMDGKKKYVAGDNNYITFPRPNNAIGQEAFLLAELL